MLVELQPLPYRWYSPQQRRDPGEDDQQPISRPECRACIPIFPATQKGIGQRPTRNRANSPARCEKAENQTRLCSRILALDLLHDGGPAARESAAKNAIHDREDVERSNRCGEAPDEEYRDHRTDSRQQDDVGDVVFVGQGTEKNPVCMELAVNVWFWVRVLGVGTYPPTTVAAFNSESVDEPASSERPIE